MDSERWLIAVDRYPHKPNGDRLVSRNENRRLDWYRAHPQAWELVEVVPARDALEVDEDSPAAALDRLRERGLIGGEE